MTFLFFFLPILYLFPQATLLKNAVHICEMYLEADMSEARCLPQ